MRHHILNASFFKKNVKLENEPTTENDGLEFLYNALALFLTIFYVEQICVCVRAYVHNHWGITIHFICIY